MTHKQIIRGLLILFSLAFIATSGWFFKSWAGSQPVAAAAVLGVSTDPVEVPQVTLLPYPVQISDRTPIINARQYLLYNANTGKVLFQSASLDPVPIASTTKIMTTYIVAKYGKMTDIVTVPKEAVAEGGSSMNLVTGEKLSVDSLLHGALMISGNDAAYTLASYIGGKLLNNDNATTPEKAARFVDEMNSTATQLHLNSTHYMDPVGLDDEGHSNALDLAKLASVAYDEPLIKQIIGTAQITVTDTQGRNFDLRNSDHLTSDFFYEGNDGGKTGFTPAAGHCLVTSATRDGIKLIAVVLSTFSNSILASAEADRALLDFGFSSFRFE